MKKIADIKYSSVTGKKIYIYNPDFVASQSKKKFLKIMKQHSLFKKITETIRRDIRSNNIKKKETAIVLYLIIHCGFRIGNKKYEKQSYGISTIKFEHIKNICNSSVTFDFIGKKGVRNVGKCSNKVICQYLNKKRKKSKSNDYVFPMITSYDANKYLRQFDDTLSSKDLRTWVANVLFVKYALKHIKDKCKNPIKEAISKVSQQLHNTPAVCKKNYIDINIINHIENHIVKEKI